MSKCTMKYRLNEAEQTYVYPAERLDELLARADAKFLRPLTSDENVRFQQIKAKMLANMPKAGATRPVGRTRGAGRLVG